MTLANHGSEARGGTNVVRSGGPLALGAVALIVLAALRDTTVIGNGFFLREIAEGLCLFLGIFYLPTALGRIAWRALLLVLCYLVVIFAGALEARDPVFVLLQAGSLLAVIVFALCWHSQAPGGLSRNYQIMFSTAFYALALISLGSLLAAFLAPGLAYEVLYGGEIRFHGLVTRPGWMAAIAGLLVGIALFFRRSHPGLRLAAGLIGFTCLALSGARTYWVAFVIASIASVIVYEPRLWRRVRIPAIALALIVVGFAVLDGGYYPSFLDDAVRSDTVGNLSGRTSLWQEALEGFGERPWFGYGLTQGAEVLDYGEATTAAFANQDVDPREISRKTLHNGYIQALFDTGLLGAFFYLLIIVSAMGRMLGEDRERRFPAVFFCLVFMAIGNFSENIIYGASVLPSIFFWLIAMFALGAHMAMPTPKFPRATLTAQPDGSSR